MNTTTIWSRTTGMVETHADGCRALNKATGRRLAVWIKVDEAGKADLIARGYPSRVCQCVAVGNERDACAKIAESYGDTGIAAEIRGRK